jgi:two-component system, OmpR family, phosphate regulon sensor histidine kinase PhoR
MIFWELLLGLAIGIAIGQWRQQRLYGELKQILRALDTRGAEGNSLPVLSRLRLGVTIFKREMQQLEIEVQNLNYLLEQLPIGYLVVDAENQLLWCNQSAKEWLHLHGWEPNQKRFLLEVVRSYELDRLIERTRSSQTQSQKEWVFHPQAIASQPGEKLVLAGGEMTLRGYGMPLPDREVAIFLENLQPLVDVSQRRDGQVADLAHELRTPLTSIQLVAEMLQKRLQLPERGWLEKMLRETNRSIDLIQHILELSQWETGSSQYLNITSLDLKQLISSVWSTLKPLARGKELELVYCSDREVQIRGDEARLTQVFLNILDNSIKYSPVQGQIRVEVNSLETKKLQVNLIDAGNGFSPTDLPYVFDRFFRADLARQKPISDVNSSDAARNLNVTTGTGLGLAIARQIILAHGGTIQAMNHPETKGAWLQIELPW